MKERNMKKEKTQMTAGIILTMLAVLFTGCGSTYSDKNAAYESGGGAYAAADTVAAAAEAEEFAVMEDMAPETSEPQTLEENAQASERKLIKTVDLYVETENYDGLLAGLEAQVSAFGGYIEYQYQNNGSRYSGYEQLRDASLNIRIPVARLDEFVGKVGEEANITNKEERVEDVTLQYVDLESRKKALATQQERLLELLGQAETVEDIIAIEQRLSEVRYELESMESQLRTLDNQIDYSTIHLNIQEVRRLTQTQEKSVWDKMKSGFVRTIYSIGDDIEEGFIWFVINIPYFIIWIVIILVIVMIVRRFARKIRRKDGPGRGRTQDTRIQKEEGKDDNGNGTE